MARGQSAVYHILIFHILVILCSQIGKWDKKVKPIQSSSSVVSLCASPWVRPKQGRALCRRPETFLIKLQLTRSRLYQRRWITNPPCPGNHTLTRAIMACLLFRAVAPYTEWWRRIPMFLHLLQHFFKILWLSWLIILLVAWQCMACLHYGAPFIPFKCSMRCM